MDLLNIYNAFHRYLNKSVIEKALKTQSENLKW